MPNVSEQMKQMIELLMKEVDFFSFTKEFSQLDPSTDFLMSSTMDIKNRISKASKAIGALKICVGCEGSANQRKNQVL